MGFGASDVPHALRWRGGTQLLPRAALLAAPPGLKLLPGRLQLVVLRPVDGLLRAVGTALRRLLRSNAMTGNLIQAKRVDY